MNYSSSSSSFLTTLEERPRLHRAYATNAGTPRASASASLRKEGGWRRRPYNSLPPPASSREYACPAEACTPPDPPCERRGAQATRRLPRQANLLLHSTVQSAPPRPCETAELPMPLLRLTMRRWVRSEDDGKVAKFHFFLPCKKEIALQRRIWAVEGGFACGLMQVISKLGTFVAAGPILHRG